MVDDIEPLYNLEFGNQSHTAIDGRTHFVFLICQISMFDEHALSHTFFVKFSVEINLSHAFRLGATLEI